jgi:DNA polymerase-3 subunit beta
MKLKVPKNTLDKAIKSVSKAVPSKGVQPILNNILLTNEENSLVLHATDLDFFIQATIPASNEECGTITLSAKKLEEIVSKLDDDDIYISVNEKNNQTHLACKQSNFDLLGVSAEEFPKFNKPEINSSTNFFSISKAKFSRIMDLIHISASRYDVNSILGGVYFALREADSKVIFEIAATDGNRLSSYEYEIENIDVSKIKQKEVVVPIRVINDVQRILETSVDDTLNIAFFGNQIVFKTQDRFVVSRLLEGVYPRYKQLIPKESDKIAQLDRKDFLNTLERVSVMANELTNMVKLSFSDSCLKVSSSNSDYGLAEDLINIEFMGEPIDLFFNVKYLIEALKTMDFEKIQISMLTQLSPAMIKPLSGDKYIYLVMPIKHMS